MLRTYYKSFHAHTVKKNSAFYVNDVLVHTYLWSTNLMRMKITDTDKEFVIVDEDMRCLQVFSFLCKSLNIWVSEFDDNDDPDYLVVISSPCLWIVLGWAVWVSHIFSSQQQQSASVAMQTQYNQATTSSRLSLVRLSQCWLLIGPEARPRADWAAGAVLSDCSHSPDPEWIDHSYLIPFEKL